MRWIVLLVLLLHRAPVAEAQRRDAYGDPLPEGAVARLGTLRFAGATLSHTRALSPCGRWVAHYVDPKGVGLFDGQGRAVRLLPTRVGDEKPWWNGNGPLTFSPDGELLAATPPGDGRVLVWKTSDGTRSVLTAVAPLPENYNCHALAFTPDGKSIVVAAENAKQLRMISLDGTVRGWPAPSPFHVAVDPRGRYVVATCGDKALHVWRLRDGKRLARIDLGRARNNARFWQVEILDDGRRVRCGFPRRWSQTYDARGWKLLERDPRSLPALFPPVWTPRPLLERARMVDMVAGGAYPRAGRGHVGGAVAWRSPTLIRTVGGRTGYEVYDWDARRGVLLRTHAVAAWPYRISPDGRRAMTQSSHLIEVRDLESGTVLLRRQLLSRGGSSDLTSAHVLANDALLSVRGNTSGTYAVWRRPLDGGATTVTKVATSILAVAVAPDGRHAAVISDADDSGEGLRTVSITALPAGTVRTLKERKVGDLHWSQDGRRLMATGEECLLIRARDGRVILELDGARGMTAGSRDGRLLLVQTTKGMELVEIASGEVVRRFEQKSSLRARDGSVFYEGHPAAANPVFSPDGRQLVGGSLGGMLVWRLDVDAALAPEKAWAALGGEDAAAAYRGLWALVSTRATALLAAKLKAMRPAPADRIEALIDALASRRFKQREAAQTALRALGRTAERALREATKAEDPEVRRRAALLLVELDHPRVAHGPRLQRYRAIWALEQLEARAELRVLARRRDLPGMASEAAAALRRLK